MLGRDISKMRKSNMRIKHNFLIRGSLEMTLSFIISSNQVLDNAYAYHSVISVCPSIMFIVKQDVSVKKDPPMKIVVVSQRQT